MSQEKARAGCRFVWKPALGSPRPRLVQAGESRSVVAAARHDDAGGEAREHPSGASRAASISASVFFMSFNPLGFALASALTRDFPDRDRANRLRLLGSLDYTGLLVPDLIASESPDMDPLERLRLLGE